MKRTEAREQAFLLLYMKMFQPELTEDELMGYAAESEFAVDDPYTRSLVALTLAHTEEADAEIEKYLRGWSLSRLPRLSLALLRMSACEILFEEGVPESVAVNEAVNLAKKYISPEDASFINGALRSLVRSRNA